MRRLAKGISILILFSLTMGCTKNLGSRSGGNSGRVTQTSIATQPAPVPTATPMPAPAPAPSSSSAQPFQFYSAPNNSVDLRRYLPSAYSQVISRHADGSLYSDYRFYPAPQDFVGLYNALFNLQKPGQNYVWEKRYGSNHNSCIATYAQWFLGDDLSVAEVGDWYAIDGCNPSIAFGYSDPSFSHPDGLAWSAAGGLATPATAPGPGPEAALKTGLGLQSQSGPGTAYVNSGPSGYWAWNETVVVETLNQFTPPYGRAPDGTWRAGGGKAYSNVIRIVFYHGVHVPGLTDTSCSGALDGTWDYAHLYRTRPGYHSYASEFYMAEGKGIIQESFLYTEDGTYWSMPNCVGLSIDANHSAALNNWVSYIDEQ